MTDAGRRRFLALSAGALPALCGCYAGPCARPALPAGISSPGAMTFGEVRRCTQERGADLHGVAVELPDDAPSIASDFRTALDVNFDVRPFRHTGLDIAGVEGRTPAIAAMDGIVDDARDYWSGGNSVTLWHGRDARGRDLVSIYIHLAEIFAAPGRKVARGDILGTIGMTGTTSGSVPHLHYGVFAARGIRGMPYGHYFYNAVENPHLYWHDGPGRVTLYDAARSYANPQGATYPVPARRDLTAFEARAAALRAAL